MLTPLLTPRRLGHWPSATFVLAGSVDEMVAKVRRGEDPTWSELRAIFGPNGLLSAPEADALPAQSG